jgi:hypothetical protein
MVYNHPFMVNNQSDSNLSSKIQSFSQVQIQSQQRPLPSSTINEKRGEQLSFESKRPEVITLKRNNKKAESDVEEQKDKSSARVGSSINICDYSADVSGHKSLSIANHLVLAKKKQSRLD